MNEAGVHRVMAVFLKHYDEPMPEEEAAAPAAAAPGFVDDTAAVEALCDEAALTDA